MKCINSCTLIGYVIKPPEIRVTKNGNKIVKFILCTTHSENDRTNLSTRIILDHHKILCVGKIADIAEKFVRHKGFMYVQGPLRIGKLNLGELKERDHDTVLIAREISVLPIKKDIDGNINNYQEHQQEDEEFYLEEDDIGNKINYG